MLVRFRCWFQDILSQQFVCLSPVSPFDVRVANLTDMLAEKIASDIVGGG